MKCKICGKDITAPFATHTQGFAWCSRACWAKEGELVNQRIRDGQPLEWGPAGVRIIGAPPS